MAQAGMAVVPTMAASAAVPASFSAEDVRRIRVFQRIIEFGDEVTAGKHPRIKIPAHMVPAPAAAAAAAAAAATAATAGNASTAATASSSVSSVSSSFSSVPPLPSSSGAAIPTGPSVLHGRHFSRNAGGRPPHSMAEAKEVLVLEDGVEVPVPLSRADAERARLERRLREQVEQRALEAAKAAKAQEPLPDFDLDDVLHRALELEKSFPAAAVIVRREAEDGSGAAAAATGSRSGSVDENSFYSSNFSTPELGLVSRVPAESDGDDVSMEDGSDYEPELDAVSLPTAMQQPQQQPQQATDLAQALLQVSAYHPALPYLPPPPYESVTNERDAAAAATLQQTVDSLFQQQQQGGRRRSADSGPPSGARAGGEARPPSPRIVRAHNLSPVAPQPAHVSALVLPGRLPVAQETETEARGSPATPPQVAMLRRQEQRPQLQQWSQQHPRQQTLGSSQQHPQTLGSSQQHPRQQTLGSSPDSSPQTGASRGDKRRGAGQRKSNKRKAEASGVSAASPLIKVEPRSPSPMGVVVPSAVQRPHKRPRQQPQQQPQPQPQLQTVYHHAPPAGLPPLPPPHQGVEYRRVVSERHASQPDYRHSPYVPSEPLREVHEHAVRRAPYEQHPLPPRPVRDWDVYEYEPPPPPPPPPSSYEPMAYGPPHPPPSRGPVGYPAVAVYESAPGRSSVRPPAAAAEHGYAPSREYYGPPAAVGSAAVPGLPPPPLPLRAVSQMPAAFDEDGVVYRRASPAAYMAATTATARRVATQPEYMLRAAAAGASTGQHGRCQGEYSVRPPAGPENHRHLSTQPPQHPGAEFGRPPPQHPGAEFGRPPPQPSYGRVGEEYMARPATVRPTEHHYQHRIQYDAPAGHHVERVASVRPPDMYAPAGPVYAEGLPLAYGDQRGVGGYATAAAQRAYSVPPTPAGAPAPVPYYMGMPGPGPAPLPAGPPGYVYGDGGRHEVYR